jgi:DGQHR domain-containing protein
MFANRGLALRYKQGGRTMYVSVESAEGLLALLRKPKVFEPDSINLVFGTNRPIDKEHRDQIADYYLTEEEFVDGARLFHVDPKNVQFEVIQQSTDGSSAVGWLTFKSLKAIDVGDGQHRIAALEVLVNSDAEIPDEARTRIRDSAFPFILVEEEDLRKRNQDFVDLSRSKPVSESLGAVMDQRSILNLLVQGVYKADALKPYFLGKGSKYRIAFGGNVSAKSDKLLPYTALRYAILTLLLGEKTRNKVQGEKDALKIIDRFGLDQSIEMISKILAYVFLSLPGTRDVITKENPNIPQLREDYLSLSAAALYAVNLALNAILKDDGGIAAPEVIWKSAIDRWGVMTWSKRKDSDFLGSILIPMRDKKSGQEKPDRYTIPGSREAVELAAASLVARAQKAVVAA